MGAVIALADEALEARVAGCDCLEFLKRGRFRNRRRELHGVVAGDARRHDSLDQRTARLFADGIEHVALVGGVEADVPGPELGGVFQKIERQQSGPRNCVRSGGGGGGLGHDGAPEAESGAGSIHWGALLSWNLRDSPQAAPTVCPFGGLRPVRLSRSPTVR